ncbi:TfuA-like protein [Rhizobium laguerreae]|uniref:TfuA-like protein n=1 Tax=Rhizobium laguerreae TaxID=1076926 RepID=UPI001A8E40DA|nr:TfuA-like protein [Rhizobium laguerreae]MBN9983183.1 TfuA domain-containing protein [Rhizobium laguerreae]MBY3243558.1 TfuA domain-containing protein [Rhizobium laguerreae]
MDQKADGPILVFLGPTLRLPDAQRTLDAIYLQPVSQGDIILAAHAFRPKAMVLIDGLFEDRPAVRHKEILWALSQGIVMIGAASMGALRAAELHPFGMIGVGLIYRWYRRWPLTAEDAVAVECGPAELGFTALTEALVDLQRSFTALFRRGLIAKSEMDAGIAAARRLNFRERSVRKVLAAAQLPAERSVLLRSHLITQKKDDARLALRLAPGLSKYKPGRLSFTATNTFLRDLEAGSIDIKLISKY